MILPRLAGGVNYTMGLHQKIGDGKRAELLACDWLMSQGCYTFTPSTEQSPIDIIALTPSGEFLYFDVKKVARRKKDNTVISRKLTDLQVKMGVRLLYVDVDSHEVHLYPHQFSRNPYAHECAMRRLSVEKVPTIDALLHPTSSLIDQSCSEEP
jgi:hypothetical protein